MVRHCGQRMVNIDIDIEKYIFMIEHLSLTLQTVPLSGNQLLIKKSWYYFILQASDSIFDCCPQYYHVHLIHRIKTSDIRLYLRNRKKFCGSD